MVEYSHNRILNRRRKNQEEETSDTRDGID